MEKEERPLNISSLKLCCLKERWAHIRNEPHIHCSPWGPGPPQLPRWLLPDPRPRHRIKGCLQRCWRRVVMHLDLGWLNSDDFKTTLTLHVFVGQKHECKNQPAFTNSARASLATFCKPGPMDPVATDTVVFIDWKGFVSGQWMVIGLLFWTWWVVGVFF